MLRNLNNYIGQMAVNETEDHFCHSLFIDIFLSSIFIRLYLVLMNITYLGVTVDNSESV